jgi:hypothetical protein
MMCGVVYLDFEYEFALFRLIFVLTSLTILSSFPFILRLYVSDGNNEDTMMTDFDDVVVCAACQHVIE